MTDETEEWVLGPVHAGMCRYESLIDGSLGLHDIVCMNEFLNVRAENEERQMAAERDQQDG